MTLYGSPDVSIGITTVTTTGVLAPLTQYVTEMSGIKLGSKMAEVWTFGDTWTEFEPTGVKEMDKITLTGFYAEDSATAPGALVGNTSHIGAKRFVRFQFAGTASEMLGVHVIIESYTRSPKRGELTGYELVLQPTGAPVTATG